LSPQSSSPNGVSPTAAFSAIDPAVVVDYLASVVSIALGAAPGALDRPGNLLSEENRADTLQRCARFASDAQVALYIQKETVPSAEVPDGPEDKGKLHSGGP
jgi:dynein heavy chain 1, cytosolic